jgi:hypothetical protein
MKIARAARGAALAGPLVAALLLTVAPAQALTPGQVGSGAGWRLGYPDQVTSIAPVTYTITFDSVAARTRLKPYMQSIAAHTQSFTPGTVFVVSDTITPQVYPGCQATRTISVSLSYQPSGIAGYGWGGACYMLSDHSLHSGVMRLTTEWWYPDWFSSNATTNEQYVKNAVIHEFGHAIGLGHPNKDLDSDGVVEAYECAKNTTGYTPVLCSPNGGNRNSNAGKWTVYDQNGVRMLTTNYQYR